MIRVLVCGGRNFENRAMLHATLDYLHADRGCAVVIAGGARGADTLAVEWAKEREVMVEVYMAEWDQFGRKAGPIRNQRMLDEGKPDLVVAFPGGRGTAGMIALAEKAGVEVAQIDNRPT
jgi:predicted Rossmann-fold nucleotide-binding protein